MHLGKINFIEILKIRRDCFISIIKTFLVHETPAENLENKTDKFKHFPNFRDFY